MMKEINWSATIEGDDGDDLEVEVVGTVDGKYVKATLLDPPEEPEFEITSIKTEEGVELIKIVSEDVLETLVDQLKDKMDDEDPNV
jgi:hypothetical protein